MAFDAGYLRAVALELDAVLSGGHMEKIFQCTRDTFVFCVHTAKGAQFLYLSAGPSGGYLYLTAKKHAHPDTPPMFCMLLRKHLSGAHIQSVRQLGFERAVCIEFTSHSALQDMLVLRLYAELMGKGSNLILCDSEDKILGVLRAVDLSTAPNRPLLIGLSYRPPIPRAGSVALPDCNREDLIEALGALPPETQASRALLQLISGIAPLCARELTHGAAPSTDAQLSEMSFARCADAVEVLQKRLSDRDFSFTLVFDPASSPPRPAEYAYYPILQYGSFPQERFESPGALLDSFFGKRQDAAQFHRIHAQNEAILKKAIARLTRKLSALRTDYEKAQDCEKHKKTGDLLMQELFRLRRGDTQATVTDYETGEPVNIELDARLSPAQNAQRYYKEYRKKKRALEMVEQQLKLCEEQLVYAESVRESLCRAETEAQAAQIATELSLWEYGKRFRKEERKKTKDKTRHTPQILTSPGGFTVLVGKNNLQNEELTFKIASSGDLWFHVKGKPGPHVVLHIEQETPGEEDLLFAAALAASSADKMNGCEVDYTPVKRVRRHPSRLPGRVLYTGEKVLFVKA